MTPSPSLSLEGLTLRYGETIALDDVSIALSGPGIHGLLGSNGSGKTSLFSLLAGLRRPTAGSVTLFGEPVFENAGVTARCCLIREDGDLPDTLETIKSAFAFEADMRPGWDPEAAGALLDTFALAPKKKIGALSRGQRSALACIVGIASRAPVTLFDESYLGMDAPSRYAFYEALLADYLAHPRLIVISTHLIEEMARLFERVIVIHEGRVLLAEDAEALRGRGVRLVGPAPAIEAVTSGHAIFDVRDLGPTRSASVCDATPDLLDRARKAGLSTEALPLQDIFVHLTGTRKDRP